jgi:MscS family membrane protein
MKIARLLLPLLLALACWPAVAQLEGLAGAGAAQQAADGAEEETTEEAIDTDLANPRSVFRAFLADAAEDGIEDRGLNTLNLEEIPEANRELTGREAGELLYRILNRSEFINYDFIERRPGEDEYTKRIFFAGRPAPGMVLVRGENMQNPVKEPNFGPTPGQYVFATYQRDGEVVGEIIVEEMPNGEWKFSSETVAAVDEIWDMVEAWPVLGELQAEGGVQENLLPWEILKNQFPEEPWHREFLGLGLWQIAAFLTLVVVAWITGFLMRLFVRKLVRAKLHDRLESMTDKTLMNGGRGISLLVNTFLIASGLPYLGLPIFLENFLLWIVLVVNAIAWVLVGFAVWDVITAIIALKSGGVSQTSENLILPVVSRFGQVIIVVVAALYFFTELGYNVAGIIAGLGVGGVVVALAAKDSVENMFGSITVLLEKPFMIGDWINIDGIDGTVEDISIRSTRIRTFADSLITIPNNHFISKPIENFGRRRYRRINTTLGIAYDTPPDTILEFTRQIRQMLLDHPHAWNEKRFVYFNDFGDSTLNVMLYCFVKAPNWQLELEYRDDILNRIVRIAHNLGVEFAFPTRTLVLDGKNSQGAWPLINSDQLPEEQRPEYPEFPGPAGYGELGRKPKREMDDEPL